MIQHIAHIGYCVNSIDETIAFFKAFAEVKELSRAAYPDRGQVSAIVQIGDKAELLELMEPLGDEGVVASFIQKRGQGLHHISLFTDDLDGTCRQMEDGGIRIVGKTQGIAFTHPKTSGGVVYEITDGTFKE